MTSSAAEGLPVASSPGRTTAVTRRVAGQLRRAVGRPERRHNLSLAGALLAALAVGATFGS